MSQERQCAVKKICSSHWRKGFQKAFFILLLIATPPTYILHDICLILSSIIELYIH